MPAAVGLLSDHRHDNGRRVDLETVSCVACGKGIYFDTRRKHKKKNYNPWTSKGIEASEWGRNLDRHKYRKGIYWGILRLHLDWDYISRYLKLFGCLKSIQTSEIQTKIVYNFKVAGISFGKSIIYSFGSLLQLIRFWLIEPLWFTSLFPTPRMLVLSEKAEDKANLKIKKSGYLCWQWLTIDSARSHTWRE